METEFELICDMCKNTFKRPARIHNLHEKREYATHFCSHKCQGLFRNETKTTKLKCKVCNKEFLRANSAILRNKNGNFFCSQSCAATYNNTHKTTGNRRSKLEIYLEEQIRLNYPELGCIYNSKETINSELDFYFPTLKLAIELNGIFHYEPIYGNDKLAQIQNNDQQKSILCHAQGIELCIIDSSACKYLNQKQKDKYWSIVENIIKQVYNRHIQ